VKLHISEALGLAVGWKVWKTYGLADNEWQWRGGQDINISGLPIGKLKELEKLVGAHPDSKGAKTFVRDVELWRHAMTDAGSAKVKRLDQFEPLAQHQDCPVHARW
jgi:hypothetical protein